MQAAAHVTACSAVQPSCANVQMTACLHVRCNATMWSSKVAVVVDYQLYMLCSVSLRWRCLFRPRHFG